MCGKGFRRSLFLGGFSAAAGRKKKPMFFIGFLFIHMVNLMGSDFNLCPHEFRKFGNDSRVAGPCGCSNQIAVYDCFISVNGYIFAACQCDIRAYSGICGCFSAFEYIGCGQDLRTMANCGNWFVRSEEFLNDFNYSGCQSQVLGRTAAGDKQTNIIGCVHSVKVSC